MIIQHRAVLARGRAHHFRRNNSTVMMKQTLIDSVQSPATVNPSDDETVPPDPGEEEALSQAQKKMREK